MGKKTTKRKTRWRTLSIGEVPSDTEEETHENSTSNYYKNVKLRGFNNTIDSTNPRSTNFSRNNSGSNNSYYYNNSTNNGSSTSSTTNYQHGGQFQRSTTIGTSSEYTSFHSRNGGGSTSTSAAGTSQSSHSTPIRSRYHRNDYNGIGDKYKSSRSNSTASEPKITFNEDEYTRITTPRQDVLFKKGYLSKKKPLTVVNGDVAQNHHHHESGVIANGGVVGQQAHMNGNGGLTNGGGGSCGESNPSTGYNSTTGGGTPEHHSLDGGDYYDTDIDQHQPPFIIHNGFVDHNGVFYVNGYDPFSMMLIGPPPPPPPGQFLHSVDFYPPPASVSGVPCYPQITPSTIINNQVDSTPSSSSKRCSTDSQADESNSPHNENEFSGDTNNFASSEQSQSSSSDNNSDQQPSSDQPNNLTPTNTDSGVHTTDECNVTTDDCLKSNPDDGSSDSIEPITNSSSTTHSQTTTISSTTSVPVVDEDITDMITTSNGLVEPPMLSLPQSVTPSGFSTIPRSAATPTLYPIPTPTHFFVTTGPQHTGFIPFPPTHVPGQPIYINDINIQTSSTLNSGIVDPSKQRYIQKRRRRKLSRSQNDIENTDNSESSTSDEFEPEEASVKNNHSVFVENKENTPEMNSLEDKLKNTESLSNTPPPPNDDKSIVDDDSKEVKTSSTVYKIDAEEFIPRSMRLQQTSSTSIDEKSINPELRAKFENYLNRQTINSSDEQNGFIVGEFIPTNDYLYSATPTNLHHHYQLEQHHLLGTSYPPPPTKHFIHHHNQFLPPRRQFVNGYNKKRQKYIKPHHFYKTNYKNYAQEQSSTKTNDERNVEDQKPNSTTNVDGAINILPSENETNITDEQQNLIQRVEKEIQEIKDIDSKIDQDVIKSNDQIKPTNMNDDKEHKIETNHDNDKQKENKPPPMSPNNRHKEEKSIVKSDPLVEKPSVIPIDNKLITTSPSSKILNEIKGQQSSPVKIHKPLHKTVIENNSTPVIKLSNKNYAQILRKDDKIEKTTAIRKVDNFEKLSTKPPLVSKIQNNKTTKVIQQSVRQPLRTSPQNVQRSQIPSTNKIQIEPVHKPKVIATKSLPEDNEWISVPARKKGKLKGHQQSALSMSLHENYMTPEIIEKEEVIEVKVVESEPIVNIPEEIIKKEEVLETPIEKEPISVVILPTKSSPTIQIKNKKVTTNKVSAKNSVKKVKIDNKSEKQSEKVKTPSETILVKEEILPQQDITKKQKGKSLKKPIVKDNNNPLTNPNVAIGESIDNLRKMSTEHSKTNLEISKEMDRLIQQGLYKNLGNTIQSLDHDKEFLSLINPNLSVLPKMMFDPTLKMKSNEGLLELNIMETLNECQRYFANKNLKDVILDSATSAKDKHNIRENSFSKDDTTEGIDHSVEEKVIICDSVETNNKKSQISNISASSTTPPIAAQESEQDEILPSTPNGVLITTTATSSDEKIDEKTGKNNNNVPIIIQSLNQNTEADLSDNDDTLLSFKFDSNENISVITEEPHASLNNEELEDLDIDVGDISTSIKHSPDPDSWSSHTNLTTSTEFTTNKMSASHKSLTEVVKEWLTEAQEKSPNVFKSPEKIYREKSAPPKLYHNQYNNVDDSDDSEPEVGKSDEEQPSKNVKGNPLFVASANNKHSSLHHSFLSLIEPLGGYTVAASVSGAAIGEDALLANRRVADIKNTTETFHDFKSIAKRRIKENVAVFARELVNTVNPVVDGITNDDEDEENESNYCCEVNENTDLTKDDTEKRQLTTARMQFTIKGAFVRDVGVIKRTVSENGAIFNNPTTTNTSIVNNTFNSDVNSNVNKSKSCIDMKLLFVENEKQINIQRRRRCHTSSSSVSSSREGSQEQQQYWEEDPSSCHWAEGEDVAIESTTILLNNEKPLINNKNGSTTTICIKNNLTNCDYNKKELNNKKDVKMENLNDDVDIIENYESVYGKNLDYLEIRQKVFNECEQKSSSQQQSQQQQQQRGLNQEPPCVVGHGAVCCSVM